jgi:hypothetical protein
MFTKIQDMINENNALLAQAYAKVAEKMGGDDDDELKEIAALFKINEIVLMELKEKQSFLNEKTVLNSLTDMHKAILSTLIELDN